MKARCLLILTALALIAADDSKKDLQNMQGTWSIESIEKEGKPLDKDSLKNRRVVIQGNRYTVKDGERILDAGTYKIDATVTPKTIDISPNAGPNAGKKLLGIYKLDGDDRSIVFAGPSEDRPKQFRTKPNSDDIYVVYKRVKK
jgi:uncharacterized protein (TIGR03067 family)